MFRTFFLSLLALLAGFPLVAQFQQQDAYGYRWTHSDSLGGPSFNWIDIQSTGTEVAGLLDDNLVGPFSMGIDFPFYWYTRNRIWIGSNGFLAFNPVETIADRDPIGFPPLPSPDRKEDLIAPFMTDFNFSGPNNPGKVFHYTDTLNQLFIVAFHDVPLYASNANNYAGANTFEVIFNALDSSITFQYLMQSGSLFPDYLNRLYPVVIGIEDITGTNGLMVTDTLPPAMVAIRFSAPANPGLDVVDIRASSLVNPIGGGFFTAKPSTPNPKPGISFPVQVQNIGNKSINSPVDVNFQLKYLNPITPFVYKDSILAATPFGPATDQQFDFDIPFDLPFGGTYSLTLTSGNIEDFNPVNDTLVVEMVAVDTFAGNAVFSYVTSDTSFVDGQEGRADSTNSSGIGIYYQPFGYPSYVTAVDFFFSPIPDTFFSISSGNAYRVEVYEEGMFPGKPGKLLYSEEVPAENVIFGNWNRTFVRPRVKIASGGFYVAWIPFTDSVGLVSESMTAYSPISRRSFEVVNGNWSPHRSNETKDFWAKTILDISEIPPVVSIDEGFPGLSTFSVSPNPSPGSVFPEAIMDVVSDLTLNLYDVHGRQILSRQTQKVKQWMPQLDLEHLPKGVYVLRLSSGEGHVSKRLVLR